MMGISRRSIGRRAALIVAISYVLIAAGTVPATARPAASGRAPPARPRTR